MSCRPRLVALLLLLLSAPGSLRAEEPPADPARDPVEVGRLLLALDPAERARGEAALLAAVQQGADPAGFVRRMATALREWADREERLVEAWIERAVRGDSEEQAQAVRLLTALGEPAVARLTQELRRARRAAADAPAPQTAPAEESAPPEPPMASDGRAQLYDVADLLGRAGDQLSLLSLAKRSADSPQVLLLGTRLVVTATDAGHARLSLALDALRAPEQAAPAPGAKAQAPGPAPAAPPVAAPAPAAAPSPYKPRAKDPPWSLKAWAVAVPEREVASLLPKGGVGAPQRVEQGADGALSARGPAEWAASWAQRVLRSADAEPLGEATLELWESEREAAHLGRVVTYRREARQGENGAWAVVTDALKTGLELAATVEGSALDVEAVWGSVTLPLPTASVAPAPGVGPVELDRPDWTAARRRVEIEAPAQGTAALLALPGLLPRADRRLVLVLALQPR